MATAVYTHAASHAHLTPPGHPERVGRIAAVERALAGIPGLDRRAAPLGAEAEILRCHPADYLAAVKAAVPRSGFATLDADTFLSPGSLDAARHAVGGICAAVEAVLAGEVANAFVACRPPGHHAERARAMGFCLFGTAAIGAKHALDAQGLGRVAVLDFDVHHGNGTQDLLWDEPRAMFVSSHQMPLYPGSGAASERGAHGQIVNLPLPPGSGGAAMRAAWEGALAQVEAFAPELILVSAGFDAHAADPLANLAWEEADFTWITQAICDLAARVCGGRVVSTLEGGYYLDALGASAAAHVQVLKEAGG